MTTISNWLLTILTLLGCWGAMIAILVLGSAAWEWLDTWKKKREQRKLVKAAIDYIENEVMK
jgi:uncharacterized membrane protein YidH (DUF202 family)